MPDFSWRTEDEGWDDLAAPAGEDGDRAGGWRPWLLGALVVAVIAAGAFVLYRQLDERVDAATDDVEAAVLSSHDLVRTAARQRDAELFVNFLSGRDPAWASAQETLVAEGVLFDRPALGMRVLPAGATIPGITQTHAIASVTLSPDLTEAEVMATQAYAVDVGNNVTDVVRLQQTSLYRKGPDSWLYAPPKAPEAYWGSRERSDGQRLSVIYPARDADVAQRLAGDLEAKVAQMCAQVVDLGCPAGFHVEVRFSTDPLSLRMVNLVARRADSLTIDLPAPSLVGLPLDGAAYQALYRGYATRLVGFSLTQLVEDCCGPPQFFQALLDKQLHRLGLQPWPLTAADYTTILRYPFSLGAGQAAWEAGPASGDREALRVPYAIVDFLVQQAPQASPVTLIRALAGAGNYRQWVRAVADPALTERELEAAWQAFVYARAAPVAGPPPVSLPAQEALLLCPAGEVGGGNELVRYDPAGDTWTDVPTERLVVQMEPLPDGEGLVLATLDENRSPYLSLWQNGEIVPLWDSAGVTLPGPFTGFEVDPTGHHLTLSGFTTTPDDQWFFLLDVDACREGTCAPQPITGQPVWSPDGEHVIVLSRGGAANGAGTTLGLNLADKNRDLVRALGGGNLPLWLDEETFLYVTAAAETMPPLSQVVAATVTGDDTRVLLTLDDLRQFLPASNIANPYPITGLVANPAKPDQLFLVVNDGIGDVVYFFRYDGTSGDLTLLFSREAAGSVFGPEFAPAGRWWTATVDAPGADILLLHDGAVRETIALAWRGDLYTGLWSPDGRWFLKVEDGLVTLLAPGHNYARVTRHPRPGCVDAAWLPE